jgi:AraC-like DNA-binding protein/quercetin dioxygenase-like cupin family protein
MSRDGQPVPTVPTPGAAIVATWFPLHAGEGFPQHAHAEHQLVWAAAGALTVTTDTDTWVLPPSRALFVPAGRRHATRAAPDARLCGIYLPPRQFPHRWWQPTVVEVDALLAALLVHLADGDPSPVQRRRAEAVVFDLLRPAPTTTLHLPEPKDERAARVAAALHADCTDNRSLAAWGRTVGATDRTLARRFLEDTGMTFSQWRTELRLANALPLLATGTSVATTARAVGYGTPSAFIAAFRRATGSSPAAYFARVPSGTEA